MFMLMCNKSDGGCMCEHNSRFPDIKACLKTMSSADVLKLPLISGQKETRLIDLSAENEVTQSSLV